MQVILRYNIIRYTRILFTLFLRVRSDIIATMVATSKDDLNECRINTGNDDNHCSLANIASRSGFYHLNQLLRLV